MMLKGNVLIVEDEKVIQEDIKSRIIKKFPEVQVFPTDSAGSAKEIMENTLINVVITDMLMETIDAGYELLKFVKDKKPLTQVIVFTIDRTIQNVINCMSIGCFGYILKEDPDVFNKLIETTGEALELSNYPVERESLIERLILCYWNEMQKTKKVDKRGTSLENLCSLIFRTIPGWEQIETRFKTDTEEIDIVILNESEDQFWQKFGTLILIECKNWSKAKKPGRKEYDEFYSKITRRGEEDCRFGFFVSINGVSKPFKEALKMNAKERIKIIILDRKDLWQLICSNNRSKYLKNLFLKQMKIL